MAFSEGLEPGLPATGHPRLPAGWRKTGRQKWEDMQRIHRPCSVLSFKRKRLVVRARQDSGRRSDAVVRRPRPSSGPGPQFIQRWTTCPRRILQRK